jgi:hypothetical protein
MSMSSHINELQKKHEELSQRVELIQRRPGSDDLEVASMKKEKLRLKRTDYTASKLARHTKRAAQLSGPKCFNCTEADLWLR